MLGRLRRWLGHLIVPRSLFWRSLLIVVVPLLILQILLTYIFYNRHWDTVTRWLAFGVAGEVALLAETIEEAPERRRARRLHRAGAPQHRPQDQPDAEWPARGRRRRSRHQDQCRPHRRQDPRSPSPSACPTRSPSIWRPTIPTGSRSTSRWTRAAGGGRGAGSGSPAPRPGCCSPGWSAARSCSPRSRSSSCACRSARSASSPAPPTASARAATSAISGPAVRWRSARPPTPST